MKEKKWSKFDYSSLYKGDLKKHFEAVHKGKTQLKTHIESLHQGNKLNCSICDSTLSGEMSLIKHIVSAH